MEFLFVALCDLLGDLFDRAWDAYRRVLNLPLLLAAVADGIGGVLVGVGTMGAESAGTWLLGLALAAGAGLFASASVVTWIGKVREEREEMEYRLRRPGPPPIAGRDAPRLDSPE